MATLQAKIFLTEEQYLAIERESAERHEYLDGRIHTIAGESDLHGQIANNLQGRLFMGLLETSCKVRHENTKVRSGPEPKPGPWHEGFYS